MKGQPSTRTLNVVLSHRRRFHGGDGGDRPPAKKLLCRCPQVPDPTGILLCPAF